MNRFHLCLLMIISLLLFSLTASAIRSDISRSSAEKKQAFHPPFSSPASSEFESEMRKVPTGPNPLHNKR
ncbi:hypothetical protein RHGRI_009954 [Rhododendron griersonianum]|uniref:Uncharacterized protein n=1 Tax=Rhododendron griersonianum TaxID=479676 RepID=A0AAV6KGP6_9ERIC|nr:hypothetical protein RHGRI_009954 [Rhododendron griersonianum]